MLSSDGDHGDANCWRPAGAGAQSGSRDSIDDGDGERRRQQQPHCYNGARDVISMNHSWLTFQPPPGGDDVELAAAAVGDAAAAGGGQ